MSCIVIPIDLLLSTNKSASLVYDHMNSVNEIALKTVSEVTKAVRLLKVIGPHKNEIRKRLNKHLEK